MKVLTLFFLLCAIGNANPTDAQTRISGTSQCSKPDDVHTISISDRANHAYVVSQEKCKWTKPMEIAGVKNNESVSTDMYEINGATARGRAFFVDTMANGDKVYYRATWVISGFANGEAQDGKWTWKFAGGTGKFKSLKGMGSCNYKAANGSWECEGEYQLPR